MDYKELFISNIDDSIDSRHKDILYKVLNFIPDYFYHIPSSSSGKYHPSDELQEGGLVLHTIKCLKVADELSRLYKLSSYELSLCKTALLLHDSCKNGIFKDSCHTEFTHPLLASTNLLNVINNKESRKVARLIRSHMGQWNTSEYDPKIRLPLPRTKLEKFVHECDYLASRKLFKIDIE